MIRHIILVSLTLLIINPLLPAQNNLQSVAEKSGFNATSNYEDVISFVTALKGTSKNIRVETIAKSAEGREIPLLIIGNPLPKSPESLKGDKRIVVYIQANIHAGEVEGKEAALMFARDILGRKDQEILRNVIFLICPNFNPDGNEKISVRNRTHQNGPANGVGVRHNGMMLDLNRDGMKAESPEVRGLITNVFRRWDPAIFIDCHTTNGSYHIEPVTFTWMVNPNGDRSLIKYMEKKLAPALSATLFEKYKVENCFYGEFNDMMNPEKGWYYDAAEPRYLSNYFGLRNRLGILNENYVYADYKSRVMGCYYLLWSLAEYASVNYDEVRSLIREADERTVRRGMGPAVSDSFAIEYKVKPIEQSVTIKTYEVERSNDPNIYPPYRRTDKRKDVSVPYYIDYYPLKSVRLPFAYLITVNDREVIDLLFLQGIRVEKLLETNNLSVDWFNISEVKASSRLNQGHYTNTVKGTFVKDTILFEPGTLVVRSAQPLSNLASYLLEPQSNDGLMTWNFFDRYLVPQWGSGYYPYPVYKLMEPVNLRTEPITSSSIY